ncbi:D-alanyl-D-alanine carboxypeptidase/D-alanyl-D-alanine-endopeptidase [sulfur-oxidizing endosymbiont of Gigantopelta aegis]|uniref:D-alanyl-D-alanine carboxypeptidase/D-alanyl-D-alanine-endopeptidase n=1 Tax=sulfur-oxidizing endosymbiont of Gigantopelta aegis TaxID=2794934 RepID=UPI0018DE08A7|nr:D-alanyl-D-alanine carboxypeptidase [sulfur-oxidizing endosymbiont of Gigantopelta aegis]
MIKKHIFLLLLFFILPISAMGSDWQTSLIKALKGGSAVLSSPAGDILFSHNADQPMVPASVLKIATADALLSHLGEDYRIRTPFYLTADNYLAIKGAGDPTLTSESMATIAKQIKQQLSKKNITALNGFWLDTGAFKAQIKVHGQSASSNPYDSSVSALLANFNTIYIEKLAHGKIRSAEAQTPLTATAIKLASHLPNGKHRINIGNNNALILRYFAELLQIFLQREGIDMPVKIIHKSVPDDAIKLYEHRSQALADILQNLLKYSNNLIANQLVIILGGIKKGLPADLAKGTQVISEFLNESIGLQGFTLEEGSGLSRKNQFSAHQMLKIVQHFQPHQQLLRIDQQHFQAKTGTLKGISTYAGYMLAPSGDNYPFVIMLNNARWGSDRKKVAKLLYYATKAK